jgi:uncharacterized Zn finger protein
MSRYSSRWAPYVPVAERRRKAEREVAKLRKNGHATSPVIVAGRAIATTFWGKAWCESLETYHDYENRLPRGRTYVRNGSVVDLQIAPLEVTALVSGSSIYRVSAKIAALPKAQWRSICRDCAGGIDSLVELLQGRFSEGVMARLCGQGTGLFPRPSEIKFSCSCPDYASMCKHVAAVLYGIGARLDHQPELLFRLRAVAESDLLAHLDGALPLSRTVPATGKILVSDDISGLFGLDMAEPAAPAEPEVALKKAPSGRAAPSTKPRRKAAATRAAAEPPAETRTRHAAKRVVNGGEAAETAVPGIKPPRRGSRIAALRAASSPAAVELTEDGYVKWWK